MTPDILCLEMTFRAGRALNVITFVPLFGVGVLAFRDRIAEELGLQTASEPELEQILVFIRKLSQPDGPQHKMPAPF